MALRTVDWTRLRHLMAADPRLAVEESDIYRYLYPNCQATQCVLSEIFASLRLLNSRLSLANLNAASFRECWS